MKIWLNSPGLRCCSTTAWTCGSWKLKPEPQAIQSLGDGFDGLGSSRPAWGLKAEPAQHYMLSGPLIMAGIHSNIWVVSGLGHWKLLQTSQEILISSVLEASPPWTISCTLIHQGGLCARWVEWHLHPTLVQEGSICLLSGLIVQLITPSGREVPGVGGRGAYRNLWGTCSHLRVACPWVIASQKPCMQVTHQSMAGWSINPWQLS